MSYANFYGLMTELGVNPRTMSGTVGNVPIREFRDCLERNWDGVFLLHTILLLKLVRLGIEAEADTISWS